MTGFLGQIGIDWRLLVAQVINFAILLWLLKRLAYKPLLKSIEENDLTEAERRLADVRKEQTELASARVRAEAEIKEKSVATLSDAERIAAEVKRKARLEAGEARAKLLEQAERQVAAQEGPAVESGVRKRLQVAAKDLTKTWSARLKGGPGKEVQTAYLPGLLDQLSALSAEDLRQREPEISVSAAWPVSAKELSKIKAVLARKYGRKQLVIPPVKRQADLLAGYRVITDGFMSESGLARDIKHALLD